MSFEDGLLAARVTEARMTNLDYVDWTTPADVTHSHQNNTNNQDALEVTGISVPTEIIIVINKTNLAQETVFSLHEKLPDGATGTYRETDKVTRLTGDSDPRIHTIVQGDYKIVIKSNTGEGSAKNVYLRHSRRRMG